MESSDYALAVAHYEIERAAARLFQLRQDMTRLEGEDGAKWRDTLKRIGEEMDALRELLGSETEME